MNPFNRKPTNQPADVEQTGEAPQTAADFGPDATNELIEQLRGEVEQLKGELARVSGERDTAQGAWKQTAADFANSSRRAVSNERVAKEMGIRSVLLNIIPVVDHFDLALMQDSSKVTAQQVISGVTMIKDELVKALMTQGVGIIKPGPNDEYDPHVHEAIMHQPAEGVEPGRVVATFRIGYTVNDVLVRPAQVAVAPALA
mgnify:CR=1 FL=1